MRADFRASGKFPLKNDKLMILVMIGRSSSTHFLTIHVGIGSMLHDDAGDFIMISLTDSSDIKENLQKEELQEEVFTNMYYCVNNAVFGYPLLPGIFL